MFLKIKTFIDQLCYFTHSEANKAPDNPSVFVSSAEKDQKVDTAPTRPNPDSRSGSATTKLETATRIIVTFDL